MAPPPKPPARPPPGSRPPPRGAPSGLEAPANPFDDAPTGPIPTDHRGAAGRSFRRSDAPGPASAGPSAPPPPSGAPAPFAGYGPDAAAMAGGLAGSRSQSMGVLAIVGGLVFMLASTLVIVFVVLLVGLWWTGGTLPGQVADNEAQKDQHIRDTGFADPQKRDRGGGGPRQPGDPGVGTERDPNAIAAGPATVVAPTEMMFHSIEINCPSGFRNRGTFRKSNNGMMTATVPNVPGDERCTVTFQGSEPAKTWISGNQKKICKFNPTECYVM